MIATAACSTASAFSVEIAPASHDGVSQLVIYWAVNVELNRGRMRVRRPSNRSAEASQQQTTQPQPNSQPSTCHASFAHKLARLQLGQLDRLSI